MAVGMGGGCCRSPIPWRAASGHTRAVQDEDGDRAERARAGQAAFDAVKHLKGRPSAGIRAALRSDLDARGLADAEDRDLDLLVDAVQRSPRRALYRHAFGTLRELVSHLNEVRKLINEGAQPKWVLAPDGIANLESFRGDQHGVDFILDADTLHAARGVIGRLLTDLPAPDDPDDAEEPRPVACWLSQDPRPEADGVITVHIGKHDIATLTGPAANLARELIGRHGGPKHAIEVIADRYGTDPDNADRQVTLPDRPGSTAPNRRGGRPVVALKAPRGTTMYYIG
jgi:hypothetical protein